MERERAHIGGRHGFRLMRLLNPGMALLIQASVAGSVPAAFAETPFNIIYEVRP